MMAKKESLSLAEQIARMEVYVIKHIGRPLQKHPSDTNLVAKLNFYLGAWTGRYVYHAGRLGSLYKQRDQLRAGSRAERMNWLEQELALVNQQLTAALPTFELQGRVHDLEDKAVRLTADLQRLQEEVAEERDAPIVAMKLCQLLTRVANRSALTATSLPIQLSGPERLSHRKRSKPRRYIDKDVHQASTRPVKIGKPNKTKSEKGKSRRGRRSMVA